MRHHLPMHLVLHSERLTLTPFDASDLGIAIELFTDPDVVEFAGGPMAEDVIRREFPKWTRRGADGGIGIWCIRTRDSGEKLGTVALLPMPVEEDETDFDLLIPGQVPENDIEVGYFLKPSAWGHGYATEACRRLVRFAFEQSSLPEVVATHDKGNKASRNVLIKSGFIEYGTRRCYGEDGLDYRITREKWLAGR